MKRETNVRVAIGVILTSALAVSLLLIGCIPATPEVTPPGEAPPQESASAGGDAPALGSFCTIVEMNGKKLTVGAPTVGSLGTEHGNPSGGFVVVTVQNCGDEPIALAELELIGYDSDGREIEWLEYYEPPRGTMVIVEQLSCGEVQIVCWGIHYVDMVVSGSFKVNVNRLQ